MGGMGKIQLSIHLTKRPGSQYSSVFWLNTKDKNILMARLAALGIEAIETSASLIVTDTHEEERLVQQARQGCLNEARQIWNQVLSRSTTKAQNLSSR